MGLVQGLLFITPIFLLAIASPTPDFILVSQQTLSKGEKAGFFCAMGIILGVSLHLAFAIIGLGFAITEFPNLLWMIKLVGGQFFDYFWFDGI